MKKILRNLIVAALGLAFLNSCQTSGSLSEVKKQKPIVASKITESAKVKKVKKAEVKKVKKAEVKKEEVDNVLFDYKKWTLKSEYKEMLKNTLGKIESKETTQILLAGHTDERGSKPYNLLLGEKRAYSVKFFLIKLGFLKDNIIVKSYGKDKALVSGHIEEAWRQNRRVEVHLQ